MRLLLLLAVASLLASCQQNRSSSGGFYSYVDATGNVVVVPVEDTAPSPAPAPDADASMPASAAAGEPASAPAAPANAAPDALTEGELAQQGESLPDPAYATDEEVQQRLQALEQDRFVTYTDVSGYQVTAPLDVVTEREARASREPGFEPLEGRLAGFIERVESVPVACCLAPLEDAATLETGQEVLVSFDYPWQWVSMSARHPAAAIRLQPGVARLRIQTFLGQRGYLHPQAVFLNADGEPMLLVDNLFSRHYPQTWYRLAYLEGDVMVEEGARWLVLYLGYAGASAQGRPALVPGDYYWAEPSVPLGLKGELVVRGLAN